MHKVEVAHSRDFVFQVRTPSGELAVDAKAKDGVSPLDLLLASLASCVGVYIRKYAEGAKLDIQGFSVKVEAELSRDAPFSFRAINVTADLGSAVLDERRKKALTEFIKNCPVHNTLKSGPAVEFAIK